MTIKKLDLGGRDLLGADLDKFARLFPDLITEERDETGRLKKSIDFEKFKARFSEDIIDEGKERYEFTWPGKRAAMAEANLPINKTLRPVVEESKNWDETENLYIEGDNLEVLKLLQESYLGKVKMIYIDPPYNTGNDFVYNDDFKENLEDYKEDSVDYDEKGGKLVKNTETNGRFHSDWCSMMYPRLKLARNILADDGVIFISIDDNEQKNLKKLCDEVFGESNFIANIIIDGTPKNDPLLIATSHEYVLSYFKNKEVSRGYKWGSLHSLNSELNNLIKNKPFSEAESLLNDYYTKNKLKKDNISNYKFVDELGIYRIGPIDDPQGKGPKDQRINVKTGNYLKIPSGGWRANLKTWNKWVDNNLIEFPDDDDLLPSKKTYLSSDKLEVGRSVRKIQGRKSTTDLIKLFDNLKIFENPKPLNLLKDLIRDIYEKDALILDFFSGSATTAHAVMDINAEDGGKRKFIMVQLPEATEENSEAYKAGYKNICEIGKERIRRAGEKILADNKDKEGIEKLDTGFRVLRVDSTNMNDVAIEPNLLEQNFLGELESNIKADRTDLDLLFACLLAWGLPLDRKHESEDYHGFTIHSYNEGDLIACFDENISEEAIKYMAQKEPLRVVFRDSCFESSQDKINVEEIFKIFTPDTDIRVL